MAQLVTIRPRENSKKFQTRQGTMTQYQKVIVAPGVEEDREAGPYKGERFPNSRQMFRPIWGASKRRWMLEGIEDNCKKLNDLVKGCKFKYKTDHPKAFHYIEEADIYDVRDPFFNHDYLRIISREGQTTLDKDIPLDHIIYLGCLANHDFQKGGETINPLLSSRVKYIITDKNIDTKIKKEVRTKAMRSTELYASLTDAKRLKIAMAMGLVASEEVDRALVDEVLWDASQSAISAPGFESKRDMFIAMCEANAEELNTRHMIQKAKSSGKLRKVKGQGYLLFGQPVGNSDRQLYEYFRNPENQEMLIRLEQALEDNLPEDYYRSTEDPKEDPQEDNDQGN